MDARVKPGHDGVKSSPAMTNKGARPGMTNKELAPSDGRSVGQFFLHGPLVLFLGAGEFEMRARDAEKLLAGVERFDAGRALEAIGGGVAMLLNLAHMLPLHTGGSARGLSAAGACRFKPAMNDPARIRGGWRGVILGPPNDASKRKICYDAA